MNYRSILIACLATLGLAVAGWGQADGKIAFLSYREGHRGCVDYECGWERPRKLDQRTALHCASPAWSPDGTKIAYLAASGPIDSDGVIWVDYSG